MIAGVVFLSACGGESTASEPVRSATIALTRWRTGVGDSVRVTVTGTTAGGAASNATASIVVEPARVAVLRNGWLVARDTGAALVTATLGTLVVRTTFGVVPPSAFPLELRQGVGPELPPAVAAQLPAVVARWREVIVGAEPTARVAPDEWPASERCGFRSATAVQTDGAILAVVVDRLDGRGRGIAAAVPCRTRTRADRPGVATSAGLVVLDSADLRDFLALRDSVRFEILLHEVGHALGFGVFWDDDVVRFTPPLVQSLPTPSYAGPRALAVWNRMTTTGTRPLRMQSTFAHWDEATVGDELMSPLTESRAEPFSALSVQAMADLGYVVASGGLDPWRPPLDGIVSTSVRPHVARSGGDAVLHDFILPPGWRTERVAIPAR